MFPGKHKYSKKNISFQQNKPHSMYKRTHITAILKNTQINIENTQIENTQINR